MRLVSLKFLMPLALGIALIMGLIFAHPVSATTPPTSGIVAYQYDSLGRLAQDVYPSHALSYEYDVAGNRQTSTIQ